MANLPAQFEFRKNSNVKVKIKMRLLDPKQNPWMVILQPIQYILCDQSLILQLITVTD